MCARLPLASAVAWVLLLVPAVAQVRPAGSEESRLGVASPRARWVAMARVLERAQHEPAASRAALQIALNTLEREDRRWQTEQSDSDRRGLPAKALARRAQAHAAYEAGQGRLLHIVRELLKATGPGSAGPSSAALVAEARGLVTRFELASRPEPISAGQPRVFVPRLEAPPLRETVAGGATAGQPTEGASGPGSIPKALRDAAAQLDGPSGVYDWVRSQIRPEFYHGRMKGALQAYFDLGGNDADTAGVLIEMMRAKDIPARYVIGTIEVSGPVLMTVTGTEAPEQAVRVLERAGIPHQVVTAGGVAKVRLERVWAEAYVPYANYRGAALDSQGKVWVPLDPGFKPLESPRGLDVVGVLGFDALQSFDDYLGAGQTDTPLAFIRGRVTGLLAEQMPGTPYADVLNHRVHAPQPLGLLPSSLPYVVIARHEVAYELPESLRHRVRIAGENASGPVFDLEVPLADVLGRRLTLAYVPWTEDDRRVVAHYGGMYRTPPYLFEVKPVLKSDGVAVASGEAGLGMAVAYTLRLDVKAPGGTMSVINRVLAGNLTAIGLSGRAVGPPPPEGADTAAQVLDSVARDFFRRWNESDDELANLLRVAPVRPTVSACLTSSDIEVDHAGGDAEFPITFDWKGVLIDADLRASAPVALARHAARAERDFLLLSGLEGSVLEDRVFSEGLGVAAISTGAAIGQAASAGLTVHELTSANGGSVVPGLPLDPAVKEEVLEAVARGLTVRLPAAEISTQAWTGVGYVLLDDETGEAAWQLQGGHSGGVTLPPAIAIPRELVDPLIAQGEVVTPAPPGVEVGEILKFGSTDFQFGTVNKPLEKALKVLVTDGEHLAITGAPVTFRVVGGGGALIDPVTGEAASELTVLSDARGEAQALLQLGKKTDLIPRYLLFEGDEYSTQAGLNMVAVFSGAVSGGAPFLAWGLPDDQFDGTNRHATLANVSQEWTSSANLTVGGIFRLSVSDPHGNPLSNIPIRFGYKAPPAQRDAPQGWSWLRPPNLTPGHVLAPKAYNACIAEHSTVIWGQCAGEAEVVTVNSHLNGAFTYAVLGDSPGSHYNYEAGTLERPDEVKLPFRTWGWACHDPNPEVCGFVGQQPLTLVFAAGRPVHVNALGNLIEAYRVGERGPLGFTAEALYEKERIVKETAGGGVRYRAEGTNQWRRERLFDSQFIVKGLTPGTGAEPTLAVHAGDGLYVSEMVMGPEPRLNSVLAQSGHFPLLIPYLPFDPEYVNPEFVTDGNPPTVTRRRSHSPYRMNLEFELWGADAALTLLHPSPVLLSAQGVVARPSAVTHLIQPAEFAALLDPRDVIFSVQRLLDDGTRQTILAASGAEPGGFRVPEGLPVPPGEYVGQLTLHGTSAAETSIVSRALPVPVCGVVELRDREVEFALLRDPDNDFTCGAGPSIVFNLCWDAKVTVRVAGEVLTAELDGGAPAPIEERTLPAGVHVVSLTQNLLGLASDARKPFTIDAVAVADPALRDQAEGVLVNQLSNRPVTRVGRTFANGVDLLDGHIVRSSTDLALPGRHLGLEVSRTYSSFGSSSAGPMGAGWSWTYGAGLFVSDCGLVNVVTPSGESQVFRTTDNHVTYTPQKGYHTRLVRNNDLSYDYFDKTGVRHHFREPEDPEHPSPSRRLEYIEEPHGDRITLEYDSAGLLRRVVELQPEAGPVRALEVTYEPRNGAHRIRTIKVPALNIELRYEHDAFGNLVRAERTGTNLIGFPDAVPRVERYRYSIADGRDRHQLVAYTGPNDEQAAYEYLAASDTFLGEESAALLQPKREYAKQVREAPGTPDEVSTRFEWDYREAANLRFKATVRDGRGNPTTYVMNGRGSPLEVREPLNKTTAATWSSADILKTSETDPLGRLTTYGYDGRGNLTSEVIHTDDFGLVETRYEYEPRFNKLVFKRDPEGRVSRWEIDPDTGDLLAATDAAGNTTRYGYDSQGRLTNEKSPRGHETLHEEHDTFGNATRIVGPLGIRTTRWFDVRGRLTQVNDTLGHDTFTIYDGLDQVLQAYRFSNEPGSDDEVTETSYFPGGQVASRINANGASTFRTIDRLNRVVSTATHLEGENDAIVTRRRYDRSGNVDVETDERGVVRRMTHDALNRLRRVEIVSGPDAGPVGEEATFDYDLVGNKRSETNVAGLRTDFEYDGLYRLRRRLLPESGEAGRYFVETVRDRVGNVRTSRDANGHTTTALYDALNRVIRTVDAEGNASSVRYDDPEGSHVNKCEEHDETRGLRRTFLYDALNRVTKHTVSLEGAGSNAQSYVTTTRYHDQEHTMTVTDARGTDTVTRLDGLDRLVEEVIDPTGLNLQTVTLWDGLGKAKYTRDPRGLITRRDHDGLGRPVRVQDAAGQESRATYDGKGLKTSETDRRGVRRNFTYDNLGRLRRTELVPHPDMSGVPWSSETRYLDRDHKRIDVDARGKETVHVLDGLDRVVKSTDAQGHSGTTRWDGVNKRAETDKRGYTTLFDYDRVNRPTRTRDPQPFEDQTLDTIHADAQNQRLVKDRLGITTVTQMDPLGRVLSVKRAGVTVEEHSYDPLGNRVSSRDGEGRETRFTYDRANRLASRTEGFGTPQAGTTTFVYDEDGNVTEERDQRAADLGRPFSVKRIFDVLNRLHTQSDDEGQTTTFDYDAEGNRTVVDPPATPATTFEYDELSKLTGVTQPGVLKTRYAYDENRNRVQQSDANTHVVQMVYDELNRMTTMVQDPGGLNLVTKHVYDENGNETLLTDSKDQTVTSVYDELNRITSKTYAFAVTDPYRPWRHTRSVAYTYDSNSNLTGQDEAVASGTDPPSATVSISRTFDDFNRLVTETTTLPDSGSRTTRYTYFNNGARRTITDADAGLVSYTYDGQNRLESMVSSQGTTTYTYFPDDLPRTVTKPDGSVATSAYDRADRLTSLTTTKGAATVSSYAYTYDANGNRLTQVETNGGAAETTGYTYDDLDRLKTVTYPADAPFPQGRLVTYGYDAVGNRTSEITTNPITAAVLASKTGTFDNANRLTALTDNLDPGQTTAFTWDRNGNQTSKTVAGVTTDYRYDVRDKLVEITQGASVLERFQYDAEGRLLKKIGESGIRQYVYDDDSRLVEYDDNGIQVAKYTYGSDRLISFQHRTEGTRFYHLDGLGSITALTDATGAVTSRLHLDAWGVFRNPAELDASSNRHAFTGYVFEKEIGLYFAKARFYDPQVGRFTSQDSFLGRVDDPPSLHRYFYAANNPLRYIDLTGHAYTEAQKRQLAAQVAANTRAVHTAGSRVAAPVNQRTEAFASLLVPGGVGYWKGEKDGGSKTRNTQRALLDAARDPTRSGFARAAAVGGAVLLQPGAVANDVWDALWGVPRRLGDAGAHVRQAIRAESGTAAVHELVQAVEETAGAAETTLGAVALARGAAKVIVEGRSAAGVKTAPAEGKLAPEAPAPREPASWGGETLDDSIRMVEQPFDPAPSVAVGTARNPKPIVVDAKAHPGSVQHLADTGVLGTPRRVNRAAAAANRTEALRGKERVPGMDLDESPPAFLREPGEPASVRPLLPCDNRGCGATMGNQARGVPEGGWVAIVPKEPPPK
jgi:RHS repeat-associated protein